MIIVLSAIIIIKLFKPKPPTKRPTTHTITSPAVSRQIFHKASYFFDSAEQRKLYQALVQVLSQTSYSVFPQARLADIVRTDSNNQYDKKMYVKTLPYQLDFVICYGDTYQIKLAIELDSPYHHNIQQQERDLFKSKVLADAQIPLLRLRVEENLTHKVLTNKLRQYL